MQEYQHDSELHWEERTSEIPKLENYSKQDSGEHKIRARLIN